MSRWLRCTLLINGLPDGLPLEDALACAGMLVALGRAIPPWQWVTSLRDQAEATMVDNLI